MNYQMTNLESTIPEMINMLNTIEPSVRGEKKTVILVDFSKKGSKRNPKYHAKGKSKKAKTVKLAQKDSCYHCDKMGHWQINYKIYLESAKKKESHAPYSSDIFVLIVMLFPQTLRYWIPSVTHIYVMLYRG